MNRVGNILAVPIFISLTIFIACSDKGTEPVSHTSTFPLTAGTQWVYYSIREWHFLGDTSQVERDTSALRITIEGLDTIFSLPNTYTTSEFYWEPGMDGFGEFRIWLGFDGSILSESMSQGIMPDDSIEYYTPPRVILDLPLTPGKSWIYDRAWSNYYADSVFSIRTVKGSETIAALGRTFNCDIVNQKSYLQRNDSLVYEIDKYYSNEGLIYEKMPDRISYWHNEHGEVIDSALETFHTELVEINIR